ncbi:hypothetical protein [Dactylosporangium matsuzakiense]|uniref:Amidohydrolase n=1 Tax=Dactylosporangium matsuzakiense TaxID=53360 RepID=A0A9W6NN64_9ACTN|nr:hypothetical protein [Dactylosporangium matsuzakiense]UWZ48740.1 hypothetical protein Dmats_21450 [Dactylosporangium matsuzakiense]GLL03119.1 hypothetical protein GCM10017581_048620 [Dactylosporangium matsuzakiense]
MSSVASDFAYGLHVLATDFPRGVFAARPGPLMSASAGLFVRVVGAGGHGCAPHDAADPIPRGPGAYCFLGAAVADDHRGLPNNHSPRAEFDDGVLVDGATLLAELAARRLAPVAS